MINTSLEILCKIILDFKNIVKRVKDEYNTFLRTLKHVIYNGGLDMIYIPMYMYVVCGINCRDERTGINGNELQYRQLITALVDRESASARS